MADERKANRLIHEASPYLQQHAHNPVDWYPWGPEALAKARAEDKPVFLSIGYSSCHWCHVMEEESFANPEIAAQINQSFVPVKVDREERPDIDQVYQTICQIVTRSGGWPLTVFLTPDLRPFHVGTYFPPQDRYGRPGLPRVLAALADAWQKDREEVERVATQWTQALSQATAIRVRPNGQAGGQTAEEGQGVPDRSVLARAAATLAARVDRKHGGFGGAPKFPSTPGLELLLRQSAAEDNLTYRELVALSLQKMAAGGLYDQLGGGFHRYSVDAHWAVPHFEKMLYDNALLPPLYLAVWQQTGDERLVQVVRETLAYVEREMTHPQGGFYSTQDADSEGEEGKYYVWTPDEVRAVLGPEEGELLCRHLGVDEQGNFEGGTTVLHLAASAAKLAAEAGISPAEMEKRLQAGKEKLLAAREQRVKPFRDEKVLMGWNGLMISAFARAARILGEPHYAQVAQRAADFILDHLVTGGEPGAGGRLLRRWKDGQAGIEAFLEDYAHLTAGLVDLYEATFDERYLNRAISLAREALDRFWDPEEGGFFLSPAGDDSLIQRPKEAFDSSMPADSSVMVMNLLRLYPFTGEERFRTVPETLFRLYRPLMEQSPTGVASLLSALDLYLSGAVEVTIVAQPKDPAVQEWQQQLSRRYLPNLVLTRVSPESVHTATAPIWAGKVPRNGRPALYICRNFACSPPATTWEEAEAYLT